VSNDKLIKVARGGNQFELLAQLGDIQRMRKERPTFPLTLQCPPGQGDSTQVEIGVHISGIIAEDGSGESWIIQGNIKRFTVVEKWLVAMFTENNRLNSSFKGYYHTRSRTGWIEPGTLMSR
jgi:hypothetical protein